MHKLTVPATPVIYNETSQMHMCHQGNVSSNQWVQQQPTALYACRFHSQHPATIPTWGCVCTHVPSSHQNQRHAGTRKYIHGACTTAGIQIMLPQQGTGPATAYAPQHQHPSIASCPSSHMLLPNSRRAANQRLDDGFLSARCSPKANPSSLNKSSVTFACWPALAPAKSRSM